MANSAQGTPSSGLARYLPLFLSAFIIGGGGLAYFLLPDFQQFCQEAWQVLTSGEEERVARWVAQFGFWGITAPVGFIFCANGGLRDSILAPYSGLYSGLWPVVGQWYGAGRNSNGFGCGLFYWKIIE